MPDGQGDACKYDHDPMEDHELDLLVCQLASEALAQLDGSEDGSNKQACGGAEECCPSR